MHLPADFDAEIYDIVAQIPAGRVVTYGQLARLAGMPGYARRVGRAMATAPAGIPSHRVVSAAGRTAVRVHDQHPDVGGTPLSLTVRISIGLVKFCNLFLRN